MAEKYAYDLEFQHSGGDAGVVYSFRCPDCDMMIEVAESMWWDNTCECNVKWDLSVRAVGYDMSGEDI